MLRLFRWRLPFGQPKSGAHCVLLFRDSSEVRWFDQVPTPGMRIRGPSGRERVVEVLQSGRNTYTVVCEIRHRPTDAPPLADERHKVAEGRRTWKYRNVGGYCVLSFPNSAESRWLDQIPPPGTRIHSYREYGYRRQTWVVDEVLQVGGITYVVFCVGQREYLDKLRNRPGFQPDLAAELLELARRTRETVSERRHRRKYRYYIP
jgi:hypothetical protein